MKTSSKSLFLLINALSKEERTYILRTAIHYRKNGKNILVRLFKALEAMHPDSYDEKKLALKIPNLSVRKNELYETILRSLSDSESINFPVVMLGKLRWAAILHYRKLFPEAISILTEVEEWAKSQNQLYIQGVILQYKVFFANTGLYKNHNINFSTIGESMVNNARNILHITEMYRQYVEVAKITRNSFLLRTAEEVEAVNHLFQSPVYKKDLNNLPVSSQCFLHLSQYYLYKLKVDYERAYLAAGKCWNLMNASSDDFANRRPQEYMIAFIAYFAACLDTKRVAECKKMSTVFRKFWSDTYSGNAVVGGKYYALHLAYLYLSSESGVKKSVIQEVQQFCERNQTSLEDGGEGRALNYLLLLIFFRRADFLTAWDYCRLILNSSAVAPRRELYDATRLVFLLVLFENQKFEELAFQCRQLNGFVRKKERKEYILERTLLRHFQKIADDTLLRKKPLPVLILLNSDIEKIEATDQLCVKQLLHLYDFKSWLNEKIMSLTPSN